MRDLRTPAPGTQGEKPAAEKPARQPVGSALRTRLTGCASRMAATLRRVFSRAYLKQLFSARSFKSGSYTAFSCVVVIAIAAAAVVAAEALPASYTSIDISQDKTTDIGDETRAYLATLDERGLDVTIYLIAEQGQENEYLEILLDKYATASDRVQVVQKDPVLHPTFTSQYTSQSLSNNSLIVVCGDDSRVVAVSELYALNSSTYSYEFAGESAITSAIVALTSEDLPTVYLLQGHGEQSLPSDVQSRVEQANYETAQLSLLTEGSVPEDADVVLIYAPESDLTQDEADALLAYLESGGSLLLVTDYDDVDMPVLDDLMDAYGLQAIDGVVVEGDPGHHLMGLSYYLLPNLSTSSDVTKSLAEKDAYVLFPLAHGIGTVDQYRGSLTVTELVTATGSAYVKTDPANAETLDYEDGDIAGRVAVGVAVTEDVEGADGAEGQTRVVWYGTSAFLDAQIDARVGGNNGALFVDTLAWLGDADATAASIASRGMGTSVLTVDSTELSTISAFSIGLIPLAFLGCGFAVWRARRRY